MSSMTTILPTFRYTEAIMCRPPDVITRIDGINSNCSTPINGNSSAEKKKKKVKKNKENDSNNDINGAFEILKNIDLGKCRAEYDGLVAVLRDIGLDVVELPPDTSCPLSFLLGDVAFVLNGMGLVTRPKFKFRQPEVNTIKTMLKNELDIPVVIVDDEKANLEGADILFTGRELFVGISDYTNVNGAHFIAKTFPEYPCSPIKVPGPYHLTHYVNMAAPDVICVGTGQEAQDVIKRMEREANYRYQTLTVPEDTASNCLFVNGSLIHLSPVEIPKSYKFFSEKLHYSRKVIELTELSKLAGNMSRLVLLLNKSIKKQIRI